MRPSLFFECREGVLGGKPVARGTRVSLRLLVELLGAGWGPGEILESYPHLPPGAVDEALHVARGGTLLIPGCGG